MISVLCGFSRFLVRATMLALPSPDGQHLGAELMLVFLRNFVSLSRCYSLGLPFFSFPRLYSPSVSSRTSLLRTHQSLSSDRVYIDKEETTSVM